MATTISSGFANSPKKIANIADHGVIYGGRGLVFDGVADYLNITPPVTANPISVSFWIKTSDADAVILS